MSKLSKYIINCDASLWDAVRMLNDLSDDALTLFVIDDNKKMVGSITDGDVRRSIVNGAQLNSSVSDIMNKSFSFIEDGKWDTNTIRQIKSKGISLVPVLDGEKLITDIYNFFTHKSVLPIDAVLMAGGEGKRLRPLTENCPKPLLPLAGRAIIDHNIYRLIDYGIKNISVTVNYLKDQIENHFKEPIRDVRINCIREPSYLGTIGSVKFVDCFYNDTVLVMNSDLFTNIDYEDFFIHFKNSGADLAVATVPYNITVPYGVFEFENDRIINIREKPSYDYYANAGIYLMKLELIELIPDNEFFNATDLIDLMIKKGREIVHFPITGYWIDIGKHEEYKKAQEFARHW